MPTAVAFRYFKTSPEIIQLAVMLYVRFPLSLRNVEDRLHERGVYVSYESVRYWWHRFGSPFASEIKKRRAGGMQSSNWKWHLDEVFVRMKGERHYQLQFRDEVIRLKGACSITGITSPAFLRASYIKPWRACDTAEERLDPYNGLALAPHIDQLFDQGSITFDASGAAVLPDECPPMIPIQWGFEDKIGERLIDVSVKRRK